MIGIVGTVLIGLAVVAVVAAGSVAVMGLVRPLAGATAWGDAVDDNEIQPCGCFAGSCYCDTVERDWENWEMARTPDLDRITGSDIGQRRTGRAPDRVAAPAEVWP